jgi:PPP family 3-phenylpropionic acid transporter
MTPRRIKTVAFTNYFLLFITYAILAPYLQLYLKARSLSSSQIGILLGCLELAGVAGPLLLGRLADFKGIYRSLIAICLLASIVVFAAMEFTTFFPVYIVCIIALGAFYRAAIPLQDGLVGRIISSNVRQYGRLRMAGSLGFIVISLFFQFSHVVSGTSSRPILVAFSIAAACAAIGTSTFPASPNTRRTSQSAKASWSADGIDGRFWAVIFLIFLGRFGIGAYYSFFSLFLQQYFPNYGISLFWAIGPFAEMITIFFSGSLIQRWGLRTMFIVSMIAITLRLSLFIVAPSIVVVGLAQLLHAFTFGTFHTAAVAYVNRTVAPERRATGMAVYNAIGIGLPTFVASSVGGYILQAHGFATLFLGYAAVPLISVLALAIFGKRLLPSLQQEAPTLGKA